MNRSVEYTELLAGLCEDNYDYAKSLGILAVHKQKCITNNNTVEANDIWIYEQIIKINQSFVEIFNLIKNEKYYDAWCKAEQVEIGIQSLKINLKPQINNIDYIEKQIRNIQAIYPYKLFASYEVIYEKVKCSICNKSISIRNQCQHIKGYVYGGKLCSHIVEQAKLLNISVVTNPVHKYAVLFLSDKKDGKQDNYDYSIIKYLASIWTSPYMYWTLEIHIKWLPYSDFPNLKEFDICPCMSSKKYKDCCKNNTKGIKHLNYIICNEKHSTTKEI